MNYVNKTTIVNKNNSLDIYNGCNIGCCYCNKRKNKSMYSDISIARNSTLLLNDYLKTHSRCVIKIGDNFECYTDIEKKTGLIREALEAVSKTDFGICIYTKTNLILRDLDLIEVIAKKSKATVVVEMSFLDKGFEVLASSESKRLDVLIECNKRNIPVVLAFGPFIPFVNDSRHTIDELFKIVDKSNIKRVLINNIDLKLNDKSYFYNYLESLNTSIVDKYNLYYKNQDVLKSINRVDLVNYFIAQAKIRGVIYNTNDILDDINNLNIKQLSIFDFF